MSREKPTDTKALSVATRPVRIGSDTRRLEETAHDTQSVSWLPAENVLRLGNLFAGVGSYGLVVNRIHRDLDDIHRRWQGRG